MITAVAPGTTLDVEVIRHGKKQTGPVTLDSRQAHANNLDWTTHEFVEHTLWGQPLALASVLAPPDWRTEARVVLTAGQCESGALPRIIYRAYSPDRRLAMGTGPMAGFPWSNDSLTPHALQARGCPHPDQITLQWAARQWLPGQYNRPARARR